MNPETSIDTSSLLTILGVIAAVWAIIPANNRLQFRLSVTWPDWIIVIVTFLLIHYLVFESALRKLGFYYSFGSWRWGLETQSTVYLLLLGLGIYLLVRARSPKLAKRNIRIFGTLVENHLLAKRFDELAALVEPQTQKLIRLSQYRPVLARLAERYKPQRNIDAQAILRGERPKPETASKRYARSILNWVEACALARDDAGEQANVILHSITSTPSLVNYLAVSRPHFCLELLRRTESLRDDFAEVFMDALLSDSTSRLYVELRNNQNLNGRHRLYLPENNRLLYAFFKNVKVAANLGLYRAIGEAVCRKVDEDDRMAERYNRPLGYYDEVGKFHCPVHAGIKLFEIMVHEGIHQGLQDHLWLHYFTHFTDKIIDQMRDLSRSDEYHEWPTPFYYLLYEIVSITCHWVEDCLDVNQAEISEKRQSSADFDLFYISRQATEALGSIVRDIIESPKLAQRFKVYVIEIALTCYKRVEQSGRANVVAREFEISLIDGTHLRTSMDYRRALHAILQSVDYVLRDSVPIFFAALARQAQE